MPISTDRLQLTLPGLRDVKSTAISRLAQAAILEKYRTNGVIYRAGDSPSGLYIVLSGRVIVRRETASRSEMLHTERAGGVLGEIPIFGGVPFPATAIALEPTECARVPATVIERLLADEPTFGRFALRRMTTRAESLLRRIDELTATTVTGRLAAFLVDRAARSETAEFTLGRTQSALANELGTAREVVVRGIAALIEAGAIARAGRSRFTVRRMSTLRSIGGV
jgi:CRP/FNR family transcriptional regulator